MVSPLAQLTPHLAFFGFISILWQQEAGKIEEGRQPNDNNGQILIENFNLATQRSLPGKAGAFRGEEEVCSL